jgi:ribosomal-protein-alanine N-acetyltransferase
MKAVSIETPRFYLERLFIEHLSQKYVDWMNDYQVNQYLESGGNYTLEMLKDFLINVSNQDIYFWAIKDKFDEHHIGNIKIDPINFKHGWGEYGILIGDQSYWGKGVGFEVSRAVIDFCFQGNLNLRKINLGVRAENTAAIALYNKLGFKVEGVYKKHSVTTTGFDDVLRMAIFNSRPF